MNAPFMPRVSVIIPAYNSARFIGATLQSVFDQNCRDAEVIVIDDGSSDETREVVEGFGRPVRYLYQRNQGPSAARNRGIDAAGGNLICFLDADDSWNPGKLRAQLDFMDRHSNVGLIFADEEEYDESGVQSKSLLAKSRFYTELRRGGVIQHCFEKLLRENFIPTSSVMVRRECFEKAGLFDPAMTGPEDRDMWSRIAAYFEVACIPQVLGRKRAVSSSVSRNVETTLRSRLFLWTKARRLFPDLAPERIVNALVAQTYVDLGFLLVQKNEMQEARQAAVKAIGIARQPRLWLLGLGVIAASVTGRGIKDLWRVGRSIR